MKLSALLFAFLLLSDQCPADSGNAGEDTTPATSKGAVKNGKIEVRISRRIQWTSQPVYPVTVSLKAEDGSLFLTQKVMDGDRVELSGLVRRGTFKIYSDIDKDSGYWPSFGGKVVIGADGSISTTPQPIEHQLKMTLLTPVKLETVTAARPTLKWKALEGAKSYTVSWFEEESKFRKILNRKEDIAVAGTEWTFETDLVSNRTYEWLVVAFDKDGKRIGYFASGYFLTK